MTPVQHRPLHEIAKEISKLWKNINYAALPYLNAMHELTSTKDKYGADSGKSIVLYFISNASTWRGNDARRIKEELRYILRLHDKAK